MKKKGILGLGVIGNCTQHHSIDWKKRTRRLIGKIL